MNKYQEPRTKNQALTIGWLYPDLMSTYGDRGNIMVLQKRCEWRGIESKVVNINQNSSVNIFGNIDLLFGGGAQDREQDIVVKDLNKKRVSLKQMIDDMKPSLFVCGSPQLLGKYYEPSVGNRIEGLGIFDMISIHPGPKEKRLIGNIIANSQWPMANSQIVGFENHGGRTYLGKSALPFAKVIKGYGNNGEDGTEGIVYKNAIGSYFHGPFLSKNPEVADWLIRTALEVKYKKTINLNPLDDSLELNAKDLIAKRLGVKL